MMHRNRIFSLICILPGVLLAVGCGNLLSQPPETVSITITDPTATPTYNSVTLEWASDSECLCSIEYGTVSGTYDNALPKSTTSELNHVVTVYSLSPSTTYYYRVVSYYRGVQPFTSAEYSFTTAAVGFSVAPAVTPSQNSATITWETNITATYVVEYGTVTGVYTRATPRTATAATSHSATLTGLSAGTTYYYRILLYTGGTLAATGSELTFTTQAATGFTISSGPTVTQGQNSLAISWTTSAAACHLIEYGTTSLAYTSAYSNSTPATTAAATSHSETLSDLSAGTTYYYRITLFWDATTATVSNEYSAATTAEPTPTLAQKMRGIWVIGGTADLSASPTMISEIDMYDPQTDQWYSDVTAGATGSYTPTVFNMVASVNGKIYVIGGAPNSAGPVNTVFEYDIATNAWRIMASIPATPGTLMDSAVYTHANNIFLIGGTSTNVTGGVQTTHLRFDPAAGSTGTWYTLSTYVYASNVARSSMGAGYFDGSVCFFGGRASAGAGQTTNNNDIYVIANNTYTTTVTEPVIVARGGMAYATYSGLNGTNVFIVGGAPTYAATTAYFGLTSITYVAAASSFQIYSPPSTSATVSGKFHPAFDGGTATGIVFAAAAVSSYNGTSTIDPTLYVFGGIEDRTSVSSQVWSIDADQIPTAYSSLTWIAKTSMPHARYGHGVTVVNQ